MPVRKIPKNYLFVTGAYASKKNKSMDGFESLLEKDYYMLLDFDSTVESFDVQPVKIKVPGGAKKYVPDVLVKFHPDPVTGEIRRNELAEVKTTADLTRNAEKYAPKFASAQQYAKDHGWDFRIVTEKEIRGPRLSNLKFLRAYRNVQVTNDQKSTVLDFVRTADGSTSSTKILESLAPTDDDKLRWLPVLWSMVLTGDLVADLDTLFTHDVPLWLPETSA